MRNYNYYSNYSDYSNYKPDGGYRNLPVFQQSEIIFDATNEYCGLYIDKRSRTFDQMVQAARSNKQCIAEGFMQRSCEGRLKMLSVSRGSLEELLNDYLDQLRTNHLHLWDKNDPRSLAIRRIAYSTYKNYSDYSSYIQKNRESAANTMVCLINQTSLLLDKKIGWTEEEFIKNGGFRENLFKKRKKFLNGL